MNHVLTDNDVKIQNNKDVNSDIVAASWLEGDEELSSAPSHDYPRSLIEAVVSPCSDYQPPFSFILVKKLIY
jgi:hypothetical protein